MLEMFKNAEMVESVENKEDFFSTEELVRELGNYNSNLENAMEFGTKEMVGYYSERIDELKKKLGYHQGKALEETSEADDYLRGTIYVDSSGTVIETTGPEARTKEISFGSSKDVEKWAKDEAFHAKQVEADIKAGRDPYNSLSNMKSAKIQREKAEKDAESEETHNN